MSRSMLLPVQLHPQGQHGCVRSPLHSSPAGAPTFCLDVPGMTRGSSLRFGSKSEKSTEPGALTQNTPRIPNKVTQRGQCTHYAGQHPPVDSLAPCWPPSKGSEELKVPRVATARAILAGLLPERQPRPAHLSSRVLNGDVPAFAGYLE